MIEKRGQWTVRDRKQIYKNRWIEVVEDQVTRPDGKPGIYGTVKFFDGISVLPMDEQGFVYLEKPFRYAMGNYGVETVTGCVDPGELPPVAAKRELKEELGIEAEEWVSLGSTDPLTGAVYHTAYLFLARGLTFGKPNLGGDELITMVKAPFAEAVRMVMASEITHGQSCVLILKANEYLKKIHD